MQQGEFPTKIIDPVPRTLNTIEDDTIAIEDRYISSTPRDIAR